MYKFLKTTYKSIIFSHNNSYDIILIMIHSPLLILTVPKNINQKSYRH